MAHRGDRAPIRSVQQMDIRSDFIGSCLGGHRPKMHWPLRPSRSSGRKQLLPVVQQCEYLVPMLPPQPTPHLRTTLIFARGWHRGTTSCVRRSRVSEHKISVMRGISSLQFHRHDVRIRPPPTRSPPRHNRRIVLSRVSVWSTAQTTSTGNRTVNISSLSPQKCVRE